MAKVRIAAQATPSLYCAAMENLEKVWDQNYVTDRKWWAQLVRNGCTLFTTLRVRK